MVPSDSPLAWFPPSWMPLLQSLVSHPGQDPRMLEHILRRHCKIGSGRGSGSPIPDWHSLLRALTNQEPVLDDHGIHMSPRFILLPFHVQRTILSLLENHKTELPINMLQHFVRSMQDHLSDEWSKLYLHLLHIHVIHAYSTECQQRMHTGFVTHSSSQMFENLCQKIKNDQSSRHTQEAQIWQFKCDWLRDTGANLGIGNTDWLDSNSHPQRLEGPPSRKRKISNGGDKDPNNSAETSSGKRLKLNVTIEDMFPTEDVDIEEESGQREETPPGSPEERDGIQETDLWKDKLETTFSLLQEALQQSRVPLNPAEVDLLKTFVTLPLAEVEAVCEGLSLDSLETNSLAAVCQHLVAMPTNFISFTTTKVLAGHLFSKKIRDLQQTAPRSLVVTMCQFGQSYCKALLDGALVPYLRGGTPGGGGTPGANQVDLLLRVAKESLDDEGRLSLLRAVLLNKHLKWSDQATVFLQGIINTKIAFSPEVLDELLAFLEVHHTTQNKCPKFAKLLVAIINKAQKQLTASHKAIIQEIVDSNQTFLKKLLTAALKKCL